MTPWWNDQTAGLIGGIAGGGAGMLGALYGTLAGILIPRGAGKRFMLSLHILMVAIGVAALAAGVIALASHQPYAVWYPLTLIGAILTFIMGCFLPITITGYRRAEQRRMDAALIRRG